MSIDHSQELQNGTLPSNKIMVLFGSETGTAEEYAFDLGNALQAEGYACEVSDLDDYEASASEVTAALKKFHVGTLFNLSEAAIGARTR